MSAGDVTELVAAADSPRGQLNAMHESNVETIQMLAARGVFERVNLDQSLLGLQVQTLIDLCVGPAVRDVFEALFERRVSELLSALEDESLKTQLVLPDGTVA